jgi:hypothetical protein
MQAKYFHERRAGSIIPLHIIFMNALPQILIQIKYTPPVHQNIFANNKLILSFKKNQYSYEKDTLFQSNFKSISEDSNIYCP